MNKFAWVTPSMITGLGRYSRTIVQSLSSDYEIEIFNAEDSFDSKKLRKFDLIFYNIGNTKDNLTVYHALREFPGVLIMHDRTYHHFFAYYFLEYLRRPELYLNVVENLYGRNIAFYIRKKLEKGEFVWETEKCLDYTFRELLFPHSTAIIVHSRRFAEYLSENFTGKVIYLPHPHYSINQNFLRREEIIELRERFGIPGNKFVMLSYGFMSFNRAVSEVLLAVGKNRLLRERTFYLIVGKIHDRYLQEIRKIIDRFNLEDNVKILGYVSDEELFEILNLADICINLRLYNTEIASGSVLEQMLFGKPVIVTDNGIFSELPDDVVLKIRNLDEIENTLTEALYGTTTLKKIGERARNYVLEKFSIDEFKRGFREFIESEIFEIKKREMMIKISREIVDILPKSAHQLVIDNFLKDFSSKICEVFTI